MKAITCDNGHAWIFLASVLALMAVAADGPLTIQPGIHDGMTPSQQLTNAVARASDGDTILFKTSATPYQLDGESYMLVSSTDDASGNTLTSRVYVNLTDKKLNFVGESDGKWSDGVVLRGNGNDRFFYSSSQNGSTFRNLTFENFATSDRPDLKPVSNGNLNWRVMGGAILFGAGYDEGNVVSNCIFRGIVGRTGAAVGYINAFDCFFTNNVATYGGGAASYSYFTRCTSVANMATNTGGFGGVACWFRGARDSVFTDNLARDSGGVFYGNQNLFLSNCVFRGNSTSSAMSSMNLGGGVMQLQANSTVLDCVFDGNYTYSRGGVFRNSSGYTAAGSVFERCVFTNNLAMGYNGSMGGAVYDVQHSTGADPVVFRGCTFACSVLTTANNPNAQAAAVFGGSYSNCTFYGNSGDGYDKPDGVVVGTADHPVQIVDCVFSNNFNRYNGLVRYANCTNTLFYGNEVPGTGGVVRCCNVVDCRFVGNRKNNDVSTPSGDATASTLVRCEMDLGCILNSVLIDCRIHTLTNYGSYCVFYGHNVATNCLIENCNPLNGVTPADKVRGLVYRWGPVGTEHVEGSDYVNCTFADNVFPYLLRHQQEYGIYTPFKNCIFYNNRDSGGTLVDVKYLVKDAERNGLSNLDSGLALSNCVFGTAVASGTAGDTWQDLGGNNIIAPDDLRMVGAKSAKLGVSRYALRHDSPVLGMGDASMFSASDLDLAGNLRLRSGILDPGCFECWLRPRGMVVDFK